MGNVSTDRRVSRKWPLRRPFSSGSTNRPWESPDVSSACSTRPATCDAAPESILTAEVPDKKNIAPIRAVLARYVTAAKPVDLEEAAANFTPQWCDSHRLKLMPEAREGS